MAHISNDNQGREVVVARAPYLCSALADLDTVVLEAKDKLSEFPECDTLIGRGLSGALVVPYVARALGLHWAIARKEGDGTHSTERVEGTIGKAWVFFDDLISSGKTLVETVKAVKETCEEIGYETRILGAVTYAPSILWEYEDVLNRMPEGFDPNASIAPIPEGTLPDESVASLATPQPYDTQDENGDPSLDPDWLRKKIAEVRALAPQPPPKRGEKASRALMDLAILLVGQRRALNDKLDLAATNAMIQVIREYLR